MCKKNNASLPFQSNERKKGKREDAPGGAVNAENFAILKGPAFAALSLLKETYKIEQIKQQQQKHRLSAHACMRLPGAPRGGPPGAASRCPASRSFLDPHCNLGVLQGK